MGLERALIDAAPVAPSILAVDFASLGAQVEEVMGAGARIIHVDVMDGHFVPPITFGPLAVGALRDQVRRLRAALPEATVIEVDGGSTPSAGRAVPWQAPGCSWRVGGVRGGRPGSGIPRARRRAWRELRTRRQSCPPGRRIRLAQ